MRFKIDTDTDSRWLNERIRACRDKEIVLDGCMGQRYIGTGLKDKSITINGVPGNALGSYLDGAEIVVNGNAQDATGDTMNDGSIVIHGSAGDATGYAMRGGRIFIEGNTGYRTGIHMKEYRDLKPVIVAGGRAGSFLGEYQAGGIIIVLGLHTDGLPVIGNFCGTGMHGGRIYLRCKELPHVLTAAVRAEKSRGGELTEIHEVLRKYCEIFSADFDKIINGEFIVLSPDADSGRKQMYKNN